MNIIDDFLEQKDFDKLQTFIMGADFDWHYNDAVVYRRQEDEFQFIHIFYKDAAPRSSTIQFLDPILVKINPISILRIKTNLLTRTPNIVENTFHVDISSVSEEKLKQLTISIFYVNTNNGYTEFEDGTKVESVANRLITFPANLKHRGTSCTDEKRRIIINFNYFK